MSRGKWISLGVLGAELWRGSWGCCMVLLGNPESWRRSRREQTVRSALHPRVSTAPTDSPPSLAALGLSEIFPDCPEEPDADFRGGGQQTQLLRGQRSQQGRAAHCQEGEGRHQLSRANLPHFGYRCVDINVQCDRLLSGWVWWEVSGGCVGRAGIRPPNCVLAVSGFVFGELGQSQCWSSPSVDLLSLPVPWAQSWAVFVQ